ncbi:hypothetical protein BH09BAC1_BH09BAC1_12170 [soil metagenome]
MERAAHKLKEKGFITDFYLAEAAPFADDSVMYKQLVLEGCYRTFLDKYEINAFTSIGYTVDASLDSKSISYIKEQTIARIEDLYQTGILTANEHQHLLDLASERIFISDFVWQELLAYYHFSLVNSPEQLHQLNEYLLNSGINSNNEWQQTKDGINQGKIVNSLQLLLLSEKAFLLGDEILTAQTDELLLKNYLKSVNKHYQFIAKDSVSVFVKADEKLAEVSVPFAGKQLSYLQSYDPDFKGYEGFFRLFNRVQAETGSNNRLYLIGYVDVAAPTVMRKRKVLMLLNKEQAQGLTDYALKFSWQISQENHDNSYRASIANSLYDLKKAGLFSVLTSNQYDSIVERILQQNLSLPEALQQVPNLTSQFDLELGNIDNPYEALLEEFARISKGKFNPTEIKDGFDIEKGGQFEVSFKWLGETHKIQLTVTDDWVDTDFEPFVNNVVSTKTSGYKFQYSTREYYIMLNDEQHKLLKEMGVFDWDVY